MIKPAKYAGTVGDFNVPSGENPDNFPLPKPLDPAIYGDFNNAAWDTLTFGQYYFEATDTQVQNFDPLLTTVNGCTYHFFVDFAKTGNEFVQSVIITNALLHPQASNFKSMRTGADFNNAKTLGWKKFVRPDEVTPTGTLIEKEYYVPAQGLDISGANPPTKKQFKDDGSIGYDGALKYNGSYSTMPSYAAVEAVVTGGATQFTFVTRIKPNRVALEYIAKFGSNCSIRFDSIGGLAGYRIDFGSTHAYADAAINIGAYNDIVIVVDNTIRTAYLYTNGVKYTFSTGTGDMAPQGTLEFGLGSVVEAYPTYDVSETMLFNVMWTDADVAERYNGGVLLDALPTAINAANRILYLDYEEGTGNTLNNPDGNNATINGVEDTDFAWSTGPIGTGGSFGVYLPVFSSGLKQYSGMTVPIPNEWEMDTPITPHIHFSVKEAVTLGETITFGFEYTMSREEEVFGDTTIVYGTYTGTGTEQVGQHLEIVWNPLTIPGTAAHPPHVVSTLFRDPTDTSSVDAYFIDFGMKYTTST